MDVAYNQHSQAARRKNRSTTNLNHLSLAPLTSKLPLDDADDFADHVSALPSSYLQGKSAPTTPRLLSRSPGRSRSRPRITTTISSSAVPRSKSATHLPPRGLHSLTTSPASQRRHPHPHSHHNHHPRSADGVAHNDGADSDWLLRTGALISTETRESKGQAWLVSRASSTSLARLDADEEAFEQQLAHERDELAVTATSAVSRRGSTADLDDLRSSPAHSRFGSRSVSRVGSRTQLVSPHEQHAFPHRARSVSGDDYFIHHSNSHLHDVGEEVDESIPGPDFVNLDEELEAGEADGLADTTVDDEAYVRRLVKRGSMGSWLGNVFGVRLFSVEEDEEESDSEDGSEAGGDNDGASSTGGSDELYRRVSSIRRLEALTAAAAAEEHVLPPKADEGGWQDAAWLLTVASKVLL